MQDQQFASGGPLDHLLYALRQAFGSEAYRLRPGTPDRWAAVCPHHEATGRSMVVNELPDGSVRCWCPLGCTDADPLGAAPAATRARTGRRGDDLLFGATPVSPFSLRIAKRADRAWAAAGLERVCLHECRHCYASYMIAAGVNA